MEVRGVIGDVDVAPKKKTNREKEKKGGIDGWGDRRVVMTRHRLKKTRAKEEGGREPGYHHQRSTKKRAHHLDHISIPLNRLASLVLMPPWAGPPASAALPPENGLRPWAPATLGP